MTSGLKRPRPFRGLLALIARNGDLRAHLSQAEAHGGAYSAIPTGNQRDFAVDSEGLFCECHSAILAHVTHGDHEILQIEPIHDKLNLLISIVSGQKF